MNHSVYTREKTYGYQNNRTTHEHGNVSGLAGNVYDKALECPGSRWPGDKQMAETRCQNEFEGVCNERLCSPYETPDVPKLVDGGFLQSVGEVVCDADIVGI